jgi:hypothetical protein
MRHDRLRAVGYDALTRVGLALIAACAVHVPPTLAILRFACAIGHFVG